MAILRKAGFRKVYTNHQGRFVKSKEALCADTSEYFKLWPHQKRFYNSLKNEQLWFINGPTACGKTLSIQSLVYNKLNKNKNLKAIIAVPQTIIGTGFKTAKINLDDLGEVLINPNYYLCSDNVGSNTETIRNFIETRPTSEVNDRILVCTHQSLVRVLKDIADTDSELLIVIDEAHHSKMAETKEGDVLYNSLGKLISTSIKVGHGVGLSTATFFRGDRLSILGEYKDTFTREVLDYCEFLKNCKWLKGFSFDFVLYSNQLSEAVRNVFKKEVKKTIVWIPSVNSSYSADHKMTDVYSVFQGIAGTKNPEIKHEGPLTLVKRGDTWIKVIELVDDRIDRQSKKDFIDQAHSNTNYDDIDVIIALGMFKEGANWKWAEQGIIVGPRASITEVMQMIGRFFRDAPNKGEVNIYQLLPFLSSQKELDDTIFNDYMKAILCLLLLEDIILPAEIKLPAKRKNGKERVVKTDLLAEALNHDITEKSVILEEIRDRCLIEEDEQKYCDKDTFINEIIIPVLEEFEIQHDQYDNEDIAEQIHAKLYQHNDALKALKDTVNGLNVKDIDFDLMTKHPYGSLLYYTSNVINVDTFAKLRVAMQNARDKAWETGYKHLLAFYKEYGHCNVPVNYVSYANV